MLQFGIGGISATPKAGNLGTPSNSQIFGVIQDCSVEFNQKLVELRGQNKYPEDVAPGDMEIKGKAAFAKIEVDLYNSLYFADTVVTGGSTQILNEAGKVPGTSTYTITVVGHADWSADIGVSYANGVGPLTNVSPAAPSGAGEYSVSAGVYTFDSADANAHMLISYKTTSAGTGKTLTTTQHLMGYGPVFELWLYQSYQGGSVLHLLACRASKMSAPMKRDGYMISDFEFTAYADTNGNVFEWYQAVA